LGPGEFHCLLEAFSGRKMARDLWALKCLEGHFTSCLKVLRREKFAFSASGFMTRKGKWRPSNDYLGSLDGQGLEKVKLRAYIVEQLCFILLPISNSKLFSKFNYYSRV
jgi:hypothetical protein